MSTVDRLLRTSAPWDALAAESAGEKETWWQRLWSRVTNWLMEPIDFPGKTWCLEH